MSDEINAVEVHDTSTAPAEHGPVPLDFSPPPPTPPPLAGEGPRPAKTPPPPPPAGPGLVSSVLVPAALSLVFGMAGAWGYETFLAKKPAEKPADSADAAKPPAPAGDAETKDDANAMKSTLDQLGGRVDRLDQRVSAIPNPDERISAAVQSLRSDLGDMAKRTQDLGGVPDRLVAIEKLLAGIQAKQANLDSTVSSVRAETKADEAANRREPVKAANPAAGTDEPKGLAAAIDSFRQKKYPAAFEALKGLEASAPDDARVWYYAALSAGLASGDWAGEARRLAERGVARERAGTPSRQALDESLGSLTKDNGRDWLDYFRKQAAPR